MAAAIIAPAAVAAALIAWRTRLDTADNALILVVVIVAVASTGRRVAAAVAALASALSFDFFLTRPYYFPDHEALDLITEILLLVVACRSASGRPRPGPPRRARQVARAARIHSVDRAAATGQDSPGGGRRRQQLRDLPPRTPVQLPSPDRAASPA